MESQDLAKDIFDVLIIGAGISGATLAARFVAAGLSVIVIERQSASGGVWRETQWPWLRSDTPGYLYSPSDAHGVEICKKYFSEGVPRADILRVVDAYLQHVKVRYEETVMSCSFCSGTRVWRVLTSRAGTDAHSTICARVVIAAAGVYHTPNVPTEVVKGAPCRVVHSTSLCVDDIGPVGPVGPDGPDGPDGPVGPDKRIVVVGARESGAQIVGGLQQLFPHARITWLSRSFANWYLNVSKKDTFTRVLHAMCTVCPPMIHIVFWIRRTYHRYIHNLIVHYIAQTVGGMRINVPQAFYNTCPDTRYDGRQPLRPVYTRPIDFARIDRRVVPRDADALWYAQELSDADLVVCATGYVYGNTFDVIVDGHTQDVDVFMLQDYVRPPVSQLYYCVPIAISSWIMLEECVETIVAGVSRDLDNIRRVFSSASAPRGWLDDVATAVCRWFAPRRVRFKDFVRTRAAQLARINITREDIVYHARHPTMIYNTL